MQSTSRIIKFFSSLRYLCCHGNSLDSRGWEMPDLCRRQRAILVRARARLPVYLYIYAFICTHTRETFVREKKNEGGVGGASERERARPRERERETIVVWFCSFVKDFRYRRLATDVNNSLKCTDVYTWSLYVRVCTVDANLNKVDDEHLTNFLPFKISWYSFSICSRLIISAFFYLSIRSLYRNAYIRKSGANERKMGHDFSYYPYLVTKYT